MRMEKIFPVLILVYHKTCLSEKKSSNIYTESVDRSLASDFAVTAGENKNVKREYKKIKKLT